MHLYLCGFDNL